MNEEKEGLFFYFQVIKLLFISLNLCPANKPGNNSCSIGTIFLFLSTIYAFLKIKSGYFGLMMTPGGV